MNIDQIVKDAAEVLDQMRTKCAPTDFKRNAHHVVKSAIEKALEVEPTHE